jgi:hypothetical protein
VAAWRVWWLEDVPEWSTNSWYTRMMAYWRTNAGVNAPREQDVLVAAGSRKVRMIHQALLSAL